MDTPLITSGPSSDTYNTFTSDEQHAGQQKPNDSASDPNGLQDDLVGFPLNDPGDPRNWASWKKWVLIGAITLIDLSVSWGASGFSPAGARFADDMHVSPISATMGLSIYILGLSIGPISLAPLSEWYGRNPIYIASYGIYLCLLVGTAISPGLSTFLTLRLLSGCFSAVTIANFGGTIADLYHPHDTGLAMSVYLWAATAGSPSGYTIFSFVAQYRSWRHVIWTLFSVCGVFWIIMTAALILIGETRHSTILQHRAKLERKRTGNENIDVPDGMKSSGTKELLAVALTRPFRFLTTEAIIFFAAIYNGYLYGISFLFNGAFPLVFGPGGHGFTVSGVGLAFLGIFVSISVGPFTNLWQERYYQRRVAEEQGDNYPEARVQLAKVAAVTFPISLFWFAWTTYTDIHWIVPIFASGLWGWSFYTLILMTFTYTEDSYKTYSASALAGIGLVRNLAGAGFSLFGRQLFMGVGYQWAGTILAFLAIVLVPIPFILDRYGRKLRMKSPWAREHMNDD